MLFLTYAGSVARHPLTISIMDWQNITFLTVHQTLYSCFFSRATGQVILTAAPHCETKVKNTVMWRTLPLPTVVTHMGTTATRALAPR